MGIDCEVCRNCNEGFFDCDPNAIYCDGGCGNIFCSKECAEEFGYSEKRWEKSREEGNKTVVTLHESSCKECRNELEEMVTITKDEYEKLKQDSNFLNALKCCGVDNWCGYSEAYEFLEEDED